jgi:hypothetical protein
MKSAGCFIEKGVRFLIIIILKKSLNSLVGIVFFLEK